MGSLVTNASPFLFPCTIEYSLICAVILFEMWKKVKTARRTETIRIYQQQPDGRKDDKYSTHFTFSRLPKQLGNVNSASLIPFRPIW